MNNANYPAYDRAVYERYGWKKLWFRKRYRQVFNKYYPASRFKVDIEILETNRIRIWVAGVLWGWTRIGEDRTLGDILNSLWHDFRDKPCEYIPVKPEPVETEPERLHREAMAFADKAFAYKFHDRHDEARAMFEKAYELERDAAYIAREEEVGEPTQSVLLKSAAALAINAGFDKEAEALIHLALSGFPPDEIAKELREMLVEVWENADE